MPLLPSSILLVSNANPTDSSLLSSYSHARLPHMKGDGDHKRRRNGEGEDIPPSHPSVELTLGLSCSRSPPSPPPSSQTPAAAQPPPRPAFSVFHGASFSNGVAPSPRSGGTRTRRNPTQGPKDGSKGELVRPAFAWSTDRRATVHSLAHLRSHGIREIRGVVQCKRCEASREIKHDLLAKFDEVAGFIRAKKHLMHDRAPPEWTCPVLPGCDACGQPNCMRPVMAQKKREINWLFLLLGQTLGICNLDQLKYFCKHTKNHRTGAKDRLLYLTYLGLCKQLDPAGPFDPLCH
ncbi:unnamed protein product [Musa hybrid cultivar]